MRFLYSEYVVPCISFRSTDYSSIIAKYERLIQDHSHSRKLASYYSLKLARFHAKVRHDRKLAKKILKEALSRDRVRFSN